MRTLNLRNLALIALLVPGLALAAGGGGHEGGAPQADVGGLVRHGINLLILLALLYFALRGPLSDFLKFRRNEVKEQLDRSLSAKQTAEARYQELQERLSNFESELVTLRQQAKVDAERESSLLLANGAAAAKGISEAAQRTVKEELRRARAELKAEAVDLSVRIAEDILKKNITEADQTRLTGGYLGKVEENARS